jgi:hypothetical protein
MPFKKGQSGNPRGRAVEKPFRDALRMELAAAGGDHKTLRRIARALIETASRPGKDSVPAQREIADRLDGKVPQAIAMDEESGPLRMVVSWKKSK